MDSKVAREILVNLVEGIDPDSGEVLAPDSVLQRASILRALLAGASALQVSESRAARRAQLPPNVGRPWDAAEEAELVGRFKSGFALDEIARVHERTVRAIQVRLGRLGLAPAVSSLPEPTLGQATPTPNAARSSSDAD
jgi:predicted component of type VI protein secretion system